MWMNNEYGQGPGGTSAWLFGAGNWQFRIGTGQIALWRHQNTIFNLIFGRAAKAMTMGDTSNRAVK